MSKRNDQEYLGDIEEAIKRIDFYIGQIQREDFLHDTKTQDAVVRNFEIIGEAVKGFSKEFKQKHKAVRWSSWAKVRDKLIHHYFGVNLDIVWDIIQESLPELQSQLNQIKRRGSL